MKGTERAHEHVTPLAARADMQHFAALPAWLAQAAQPDRVADVIRRRIPALAAGELTLEVCKIGGLRLNTTTHTWSGTYTLTLQTPAQRQLLSLQGTLFPLGRRAPRRAHTTDAPLGSPGWHWYLPELRLELAS